ncbi:MAG: hypothetical protein ABJC09_10420 [Terriglobia bacterium]
MTLTRFTAPAFSIFMAIGCGSLGAANAPVIGMASAAGGLTLDNAKVSGNTTLFEGSRLQAEGYSHVRLSNGTRLDLGAGSKVQLFANRASLESGVGEVQSGSGFEMDAKTLKIRPSGANSIARVKLDSGNRVLVTALNAPVNVLNREGLLVARVTPGLPLSFLPQAAASGAFDDTGCVVQKGGAAVMVDATGNQIFELRGADLRKAIGSSMHVVGMVDSSATAGAASQVVKVTSATITTKGGCSAAAAKVGGTTTAAGLAAGGTAVGYGAVAGAGAAGGVSTTKIIGGVAAAAAATIGGLAAAGVIGGSNSN